MLVLIFTNFASVDISFILNFLSSVIPFSHLLNLLMEEKIGKSLCFISHKPAWGETDVATADKKSNGFRLS